MLHSFNSSAADCSTAYSSAEYAYTYAKRGYNSDNLDDVRYYARKVKSAADEAMSEAGNCSCDDAHSNADYAYTNAKRAYNSEDLDDALNYMRRAKSAADDAMSSAQYCEDDEDDD